MATLPLLRILILDTYYPAFLDAHYRGSPRLRRSRYTEQWRSLMGAFFGTSDAYSHHLAELGHEAHELVVNCRPLQWAWAKENGVPVPSRRWRRNRTANDLPEDIMSPAEQFRSEVVLAQTEWFQPDVVYVQDLSAVPMETFKRLRGGTSLLVGQLGTEPAALERLTPFDLLLTSFPHFVGCLGRPTEYFRIGFDPRVLERLDAVPRSGVVFVGSLRRSPRWSANELIAQAAEEVPIGLWGYGSDDWPSDSVVRQCFRGEAWGLDMYRRLAGARIAVNRHGDVAGDYANNMRLYEATGVGTLLVTDAKRNLGDLFEVGREVVEYESLDELVKLVRYYLDHEDERAAIAAAGQRRTLEEHTYEQRMRELASILERYMPVAGAPRR
jgi:spore maturation protein CgeB